MAVVNKKNNNNNEREKTIYKWGNSGPNYWQKENNSVLLASLRKSDKNFYELVLKIQTLDDDGKFVKNEDGTYDNGYFNFSAAEVAKVRYQLEQMFPTNDMDAGTIGGIIINHISAQSNNGSQFEIVAEEDGVFVYITYVQNAEATAEYKHLLSNDQTLRFYDENGDESEEVINMDIVSIKELFSSAYAMVSGLVDSTFEVNGFNVNGKSGESKSGGKVTGGLNRKVRSTLGSKRAESISEDDEDEDEVPVKKPIKKTTSKLAKASNMKALLDDEDEEDD